jgi:hypothetical protein
MSETTIAIDAHAKSVHDRARAGSRICRIGGLNRRERRRMGELASRRLRSDLCRRRIAIGPGVEQKAHVTRIEGHRLAAFHIAHADGFLNTLLMLVLFVLPAWTAIARWFTP